MVDVWEEPMIDERLKEIRERLDDITEPPWKCCLGSGNFVMTGVVSAPAGQMVADCRPDYFYDEPEVERQRDRDHRPDMNFIVDAPSDIAYLLELVEELRDRAEEKVIGWRVMELVEHAFKEGVRFGEPNVLEPFIDGVWLDRDDLREDVEIVIGSDTEDDDEMTLRRLLWLRHGCDALYGDDGEMSCGSCLIDFKRDSPEVIASTFRQQGIGAFERFKGEEDLEGLNQDDANLLLRVALEIENSNAFGYSTVLQSLETKRLRGLADRIRKEINDE